MKESHKPHRWNYGKDWAEVALGVDKKRYHQGETVACELFITGNGSLDRLRGFEATLQANKQRSNRQGMLVAGDITYETSIAVDQRIDLIMGEPVVLPFDFQIPKDLGFTEWTLGWSLAIEFDLPGGSTDSVHRTLRILPAKVLMDIVDTAVKRLGFEENLHIRQWRKDTLRTRFLLEARNRLKRDIDDMRLEIAETDSGDVEGTFVFNLQEHNLTDHLKSLVGADKVEIPFMLTRDELYDRDSHLNEEAIEDYLRAQIADVVSERKKRF